MVAGTNMPPIAAAIGRAARLMSESAPCAISRLISRPATRKNTAISKSLIQKWSDRSIVHSPIPIRNGVCHSAS